MSRSAIHQRRQSVNATVNGRCVSTFPGEIGFGDSGVEQAMILRLPCLIALSAGRTSKDYLST